MFKIEGKVLKQTKRIGLPSLLLNLELKIFLDKLLAYMKMAGFFLSWMNNAGLWL